MVEAVQEPLAECTAILYACIVEHQPPPCALTIQKTCTDQQWNRFLDIARIQDQMSLCRQHTKHFDLSQYAEIFYTNLTHQLVSLPVFLLSTCLS